MHPTRPGYDIHGDKIIPGPPFNRDPEPVDEAPIEIPSPPGWLGEHARGVWNRTLPQIWRLQLTKREDMDAFAAYCDACQTFRDCVERIAKDGLTVEKQLADGRVQFVAHPLLAVKKQAADLIKSYATHFGLTPASENAIAGHAAAGSAPRGSTPADDAGSARGNPFSTTG